MKLVNWNVGWATPKSCRTPKILDALEKNDPEIICLTESKQDLFSQRDTFKGGHIIYSKLDYGYKLIKGRRKVLLWSKQPWELKSIDRIGHKSLPPGRFVSGVTNTSLGKLMIIGVCIPWPQSRAEKERSIDNEKRKPWQDHEDFLAPLGGIIKRKLWSNKNLLLIGDFNQRIGYIKEARNNTPEKRRILLQKSITSLSSIITSKSFKGRRSIDHIVLSLNLEAESVKAIDDPDDKKPLSKGHFGVIVNLNLA